MAADRFPRVVQRCQWIGQYSREHCQAADLTVEGHAATLGHNARRGARNRISQISSCGIRLSLSRSRSDPRPVRHLASKMLSYSLTDAAASLNIMLFSKTCEQCNCRLYAIPARNPIEFVMAPLIAVYRCTRCGLAAYRFRSVVPKKPAGAKRANAHALRVPLQTRILDPTVVWELRAPIPAGMSEPEASDASAIRLQHLPAGTQGQ